MLQERCLPTQLAINISSEGHKHLGAVLGSRSFLEEYVGEKVEDWVHQVSKLAEFAISQPQAGYGRFYCWSAAPLYVLPEDTPRYH